MIVDLPDNPGMLSQMRALAQTEDEWLREYETGKPVSPAAWCRDTASDEKAPDCLVNNEPELIDDRPADAIVHLSKDNRPCLRYETYRTTTMGRLAIVFVWSDNDDEVIAWFNVETRKQRGEMKSSATKTGVKGYFYPVPRSKFRKFWLRVFGRQPYRWGAAYRIMSHLDGIEFTGDIVRKSDANGDSYFQVNDLRLRGCDAF